MFEYDVPNSVRESLDRYVNQGIKPGGFVTAVLENNLMEAIGRADHINIEFLKDICGHIYNNLPAPCHGSPAKVQAWLEKQANFNSPASPLEEE